MGALAQYGGVTHETPPTGNYLTLTCLTGEVELLKPAEAEIPEALNAALESEEQDNDFNTHVLF